jgi:hypothetical protein
MSLFKEEFDDLMQSNDFVNEVSLYFLFCIVPLIKSNMGLYIYILSHSTGSNNLELHYSLKRPIIQRPT